MKNLTKTCMLIILGSLTLLSCSKNEFDAAPNASCVDSRNQFGDNSCSITVDGLNTYSYIIQTGAVDILFVVDNSFSMYEEQSRMADRFPGFIDSISNLNYQIAITTTDISGPSNGSKPHNNNGALQDGKFIKFATGKDYLSSSSDEISLIKTNFIDTIKRPETEKCKNSKNKELICPSWDERGIAALNLAFKRNHSEFFRKNSHLAVVILSDEDERSQGGTLYQPLESIDSSANLLGQMAKSFGAEKVMSVHSVIIQPGDESCRSQQKNQVKHAPGNYGTRYNDLSNACERDGKDDKCKSLLTTSQIIKGAVGNICSNDYGRELGNIAEKIKGIDFIQLPCEPVKDTLSIVYEEDKSPVLYSIKGTRVTFTTTVGAGVKIRPSFKCHR